MSIYYPDGLMVPDIFNATYISLLISVVGSKLSFGKRFGILLNFMASEKKSAIPSVVKSDPWNMVLLMTSKQRYFHPSSFYGYFELND